jgi:hypothetical protein
MLKMSKIGSFVYTNRASENMGADIRLPAEDRLSDCARRFPGKNSRE